ncbi:MAG: DUF4321 domain-containing protein [Clostridia bacterium]|nr:DUF4321 domain-containing protein [Clostridia bacterium]
MKGYKGTKSSWVLVALLVIGSLLGSALGSAFAKEWPLLQKSATFGFNPTTLNLGFLNLTLGAKFSLNSASALGALVGWLAYKKM